MVLFVGHYPGGHNQLSHGRKNPFRKKLEESRAKQGASKPKTKGSRKSRRGVQTRQGEKKDKVDRLVGFKSDATSISNSLEALAGRKSKWSGNLKRSDDLHSFASFDEGGDISLGGAVFGTGIGSIFNPQANSDENVRRAILHEQIHGLSTVADGGIERTYYKIRPGWEEGPVETLQRRFYPRVAEDAGFDVPDNDKTYTEGHAYNPYVRAIEQMANTLGEPIEDFSLSLLQVPIIDRPDYVKDRLLQKHPDKADQLTTALERVEKILNNRVD